MLNTLRNTALTVASLAAETFAAAPQRADSKEHWAKLIEAFQPRHPKLAELMLRAEDDVLAYKGSARSRLKRSPGSFPRRRSLPQAHWRQIHSTNPLERLNKEIKRRTNVVGVRRENDSLDHFLNPPHSPTTPPSDASSAR